MLDCEADRHNGSKKMAFCYVIKCSDKSYYVGSTKDIVGRFKNHKLGKVRYTKSRSPLKLIFVKEFETYSEAYNFEQRVKSWKKRKSIENMLNKSDNVVSKYCPVV